MIPHSRAASAALTLAAALAACTTADEPIASQAAEAAAESPHSATPRIGTASAALQTGVSTGTITRAPQRRATVPPPPATGPSIAALHAAASGAPGPLIPEPEPEAGEAPAPAPQAAAPAPAPAAQPAGLSAAETTEGRRLFNAYSCGACHVLADAEGTGHVGPALDGNRALTRDYVINIVTNGRGAMPGFGGQLSDQEIALLAAYIMQVRK